MGHGPKKLKKDGKTRESSLAMTWKAIEFHPDPWKKIRQERLLMMYGTSQSLLL
jgi:hypothetical protein